jgi:colanic acid biosynthesis glycosyl transferase WcaI
VKKRKGGALEGWERRGVQVAIASCVFPPEVVISSQTSSRIAEGLAARGHEVIVLAPYPSRAGAAGGRRRAWYREEGVAERIRVIRCPAFASRQSSMGRRLLEYMSFGISSALALLVLPRAHALYANSWPVFGAGPLALAARLMGIPLVLSIQDIYPESLVAQGRLKETNVFYRFLRRVDGLIARSADAVVVIAESFWKIYVRDRGVDPARVEVIPNWVETKAIIPDSPGCLELREKHGIPSSAFVVGYGGNVGAASGVEGVVSAFTELQDLDDTFLLIAGEGSRLTACEKQAKTLGLPRVRFHTPWLPAETSDALAAADMLVLPTQGEQALVSMPSKLIAYMLASRPILAVASENSDLANTIRESKCGWITPPADPAALARVIREIRTTWGVEAREKGRSGREYALERFTRDACLPRILELIETAAGCYGH